MEGAKLHNADDEQDSSVHTIWT